MRVLLLVSQPEDLDTLRAQLAADKRISHVASLGITTLSPADPSVDDVDLLILGDDFEKYFDLQHLEELSRSHPRLLILLLVREQNTDFLVRAVSAGVREILRWPATAAEINHTVTQCLEKVVGLGHDRNGQIISLIAAKGGSGATFVSANLGFACASQLGQRVLLIDLDLQYGDLSFALGEKTRAAHVGVLAQDEELDREFLEASCTPLRHNLSLLPAPVSMTQGDHPAPSQMSKLLALAAHTFDLVLVDMPNRIDSLSISTMLQSNRIMQVVTPTVTDIRNQQRQSQYLHAAGVPLAKVSVVLNKMPNDIGATPFINPFVEEVTQQLSDKIIDRIPFDDETALLALGAGESVITIAQGSAISQSILSLGRQLVDVAESPRTWRERLKSWLD
jgi:pilus assembly protein CpaE